MAGKTARNVKTGKRGRAISRGGPGAAGVMIRSTAAMFAWAVRQELVPSNPSVGMQKVSARPRERFLSLQEAQRLLETLDAMVSARQINASQAAIIRLLLFTGARKSEIVRLSWLEVDLERRRIVLPWHRSKTGQRTIPLNIAARRVHETGADRQVCVSRARRCWADGLQPFGLGPHSKNRWA